MKDKIIFIETKKSVIKHIIKNLPEIELTDNFDLQFKEEYKTK